VNAAATPRDRGGEGVIRIRAEQPQDAAAVRRVLMSAFPSPAEADLVEQLRAGGKMAVSLVAESEDVIIGHVAFSRVSFAPPLDYLAYGLGPLAVMPGHERHAAGRRLVQNGLAACRALDAWMVVVLGDVGYYSRFGFAPASRHGLLNEFGAADTFMVFMLKARAHPPPATLVKYAPEFTALARGAHL